MKNNIPFSKFSFARFEFTLEALSEISLPKFSGTTFRGAFGYSLKSVSCIMPQKDCKKCIHSSICVYSYVFETPIPENSKIMRKYPSVPHPFVLEPPDDGKTLYKKNEKIFFGLTLIGKAIPYLPYFIHSFEKLGDAGLGKRDKDRGKFRVLQISQGNKKIYRNGILSTNYLVETAQKFWQNPPSVNRLAITFLTPVKIIYKGKVATNLEFHILFRNLVRRLSLLLYFHTGQESNLDFKKLIESSNRIKLIKQNLKEIKLVRYSSRQKQKIPLQAVTGRIVYEGQISNFYPFLKLGEILHIGKNTSFGLGRYKIEIL